MKMDLFKIDKESPSAISDQIVNLVQQLIVSGELSTGEQLPPERMLAKHLHVSRGTITRAYTKLSKMQMICELQGSGSYVQRNGHLFEQNQKKEAAKIIESTFSKLSKMGLSDKEIINLVNLRYLGATNHGDIRKVTIMVVSNNHDILNELEQQLSYLSFLSHFPFMLSFMTLDTIATNPDPVQMLLSYDLIIATSIDYPEIIKIAPMLKSKILEAVLTPKTKTLSILSQLPQDSKFNVVYRTETFRKMVVNCLLQLGFHEENIFCFRDVKYRPYRPKHHFKYGANVIINFNESPVYTNPTFGKSNSEFVKNGGHIIRFEYQIGRTPLVQIEDRIQKLLGKNELDK